MREFSRKSRAQNHSQSRAASLCVLRSYPYWTGLIDNNVENQASEECLGRFT